MSPPSASSVKYARIKEGVNKIWCLTISRPFSAPVDRPYGCHGAMGRKNKAESTACPGADLPAARCHGAPRPLITPQHGRRCCSAGMPGDKGSVFWIIFYERVWERGRGSATWQGIPCLLTLSRAGNRICGDHPRFVFLTPPIGTDPERY